MKYLQGNILKRWIGLLFVFHGEGLSQIPPTLILPGFAVDAEHGDWMLSNWPASFQIHFSSIGAGYHIVDGFGYLGWCAEDNFQRNVDPNQGERVLLYSSFDPKMPIDMRTYQAPEIPKVREGIVLLGDRIPWAEVNWILNNKPVTGTPDEIRKDIQKAIWLLIWGEAAVLGPPAPRAIALATEATRHADFIPVKGQIIAVILYADGIGKNDPRRFQDSIIETLAP